MLNIKLSMPGTKSNVNISQFTDNDENIVGNCQFFINTNRMEKPDFWFVIEDLDRIAETSHVSIGLNLLKKDFLINLTQSTQITIPCLMEKKRYHFCPG